MAPALPQGRGRAGGDPLAGWDIPRPGARQHAAADPRAREREPGIPRAHRGRQGSNARLVGAARVSRTGRLAVVTAPKNAVRVTIGGEEFTVRSEQPPEYT